MTPRDPRPLRLGELLDRSVTLCVRRGRLLAPIFALVTIPLALGQYAADPDAATAGLGAEVGQAIASVSHVARDGRLAGPQPHIAPSDVALVVLTVILSTLATVACGIAVAQADAGGEPSLRAVYGGALRRWRALLAAGATAAGLLAAALVAALVILMVVFFPLATIVGAAHLDLRVLAVPFFAVGAAAAAVAVAFGSFALDMMLVSIALEDVNPLRGVGLGLARTFGRGALRRSCLAATISASVSIVGAQVLAAAGDAIAALTRVPALSFVAQTAGEIFVDTLVTAFTVLYAIDAAVRHEGYDLALAAGRSGTALGEFHDAHPNASPT